MQWLFNTMKESLRRTISSYTSFTMFSILLVIIILPILLVVRKFIQYYFFPEFLNIDLFFPFPFFDNLKDNKELAPISIIYNEETIYFIAVVFVVFCFWNFLADLFETFLTSRMTLIIEQYSLGYEKYLIALHSIVTLKENFVNYSFDLKVFFNYLKIKIKVFFLFLKKLYFVSFLILLFRKLVILNFDYIFNYLNFSYNKTINLRKNRFDEIKDILEL